MKLKLFKNIIEKHQWKHHQRNALNAAAAEKRDLAEQGEPRWYCTWECQPVPGIEIQGYWEKEVVFPATAHNDICLTVLPKWRFWGYYDLTCEHTRSRDPTGNRRETPQHQNATATKGNSTGSPASATSVLQTTPTPGMAQTISTPPPGSTLELLLDPYFDPKKNQYRDQLRNITRDCVNKQLRYLAPCFEWRLQYSELHGCHTSNKTMVSGP